MNAPIIPSEVKLGAAPMQEVNGALAALDYAKSIRVVSPSTYGLAAEELKAIKIRYNRIEDERKKMKRPVIDAGRAIDQFFDTALAPLEQAEKVIKATMLTYQSEVERRQEDLRAAQAEEARKARVEAERIAREAREKAEAEARRQREEAQRRQREADEAAARARAAKEAGDREAAADAERERKRAEDEQRRALAAAEKAEAKGEERAAGAMAAAAVVAAQPAAVVDVPAAKGTATRNIRTAKVRDFRMLVDAVSAGKVPEASLLPNMKVLDRAAASLGEELPKFYPGVELVEEKGLSVRTK